ncbi:LacI family transcriptional regulator [Nakamurella silvestris]|nr:LacI family transcriptional regulator [Nakamurella silvestris]
MSGIVDLAASVGVSPATVSRALRGLPGVSDSTREAVRAAAVRMGYVASPSASALPTGRTNAIGVLVPWISRWFFTTLVDGAQKVVSEAGYDMLLYPVGIASGKPHRIDTRVLSKRVDGLLALSVHPIPEEQAELRRFRSPVVTVGPVTAGVHSVNIDDVFAGRDAAEHLISLGHTRIAFAGGDPADKFGFPVAPDRYTGICNALLAHGITPDPRLQVPAEFVVGAGHLAFDRLWDLPERPTAIIAASDEIAMGVLYRAHLRGVRVPEDCSVMGFDGHDMSYLFGLTTISQPVREQGRVAAALLIEMMASSAAQEPQSITMPTQLVVRSTTGPA